MICKHAKMRHMQSCRYAKMQICRWSKEYWGPGQPANSEDWSEDFVVLDPRLDCNNGCVFAFIMKIIYKVFVIYCCYRCDSLL